MRNAESVLRAIVIDVNAVRCRNPEFDGPGYFGPFEVGDQDRNGNHIIEWPNLDLLVKEAEMVLKGPPCKDGRTEHEWEISFSIGFNHLEAMCVRCGKEAKFTIEEML